MVTAAAGPGQDRGLQLVESLHVSFTLGGGQFYTKPGVEFVPTAQAEGSFERRRSAYQGLAGTAFLDDLKSTNPLGVLRRWNGAWSAEAKA